MNYMIEKGVAIPAGSSKYPWPDMEHGDSVLLPVEADDNIEDAQRRYSNSAREWLRRERPEWKVITRREEGGVRVWFVDPAVEE